MHQRRTFSGNGLEMPIRGHSEREVTKTKQIKGASNYLVGSLNDFSCRFRPVFLKLSLSCFLITERVKKSRLRSRSKVLKQFRRRSEIRCVYIEQFEEFAVRRHLGLARPTSSFHECCKSLRASHS